MSNETVAAPGPVACPSCGTARGAGEWCPLCLERYDRTAVLQFEPPFDSRLVDPRPAPAAHEYSRTKAGPTSFGFGTRVGLSIIPVVIAFFAIRNVMRSRHDPTGAYYIVLAVPTLVIAIGFLAFVWRKERIS